LIVIGLSIINFYYCSLNITFLCSINKHEENVHYPTENNTVNLAPEIIERIVCHLYGRTLLKLKTLSKTCYDIVSTVVRLNKLWKKTCFEEIPNKYLIEVLVKSVDRLIRYSNLISLSTFLTKILESLTENQCVALYKKWLKW